MWATYHWLHKKMGWVSRKKTSFGSQARPLHATEGDSYHERHSNTQMHVRGESSEDAWGLAKSVRLRHRSRYPPWQQVILLLVTFPSHAPVLKSLQLIQGATEEHSLALLQVPLPGGQQVHMRVQLAQVLVNARGGGTFQSMGVCM